MALVVICPLVGLGVKNLLANAGDEEMSSLGWEDPLEEGVATHSTVLVWRIPWTEEPGGLQSVGEQRAGHDEHTHAHSRDCGLGAGTTCLLEWKSAC